MEYEDIEDETPPWCCSARLTLGLLGFVGFLSVASQAVAMDIGVVCMLNQTGTNVIASEDFIVPAANETLGHVPDPYGPCGKQPWLFSSNMTLVPKEGEFDWSQAQQTVIFGTYFWGYVGFQVPAGWMTSRLGARFVMPAFMLMTSATTVLIPIAARTHYFILILLRFLGGVGAGGALPCMYAVWGKWAPPDERTRLVALCFSGMMFGHLVAYPLSAVLCRVGFDGGWPSIFYILGSVGVVWSIVWLMIAHDSPTEHPRISKEEKTYLVQSLTGEVDFMLPNERFSMPWFKCFTSLPFLAIVVCNFTYDWAFYTFETCIPLYLKTKLSFDIKRDPVLSGLPFAGLWFLIIVSGLWSDKLRSRGILSTTTTRKIMQCIGSLGPAGMMVGLGFLNCQQSYIAVALYVMAFAMCGFQFSGFNVSHLDIAPRYAGVLYGISSCLGSLAHVGGPLLLEIITSENTQEQWQTTFFLSATFLAFGAAIFTVCGSGDLQEWARCNDLDLETEYSSDWSDSFSTPEEDQDLTFESATEESPTRSRRDARHRRRRSSMGRRDRKASRSDVADTTDSNPTANQDALGTPVNNKTPAFLSPNDERNNLADPNRKSSEPTPKAAIQSSPGQNRKVSAPIPERTESVELHIQPDMGTDRFDSLSESVV